MKDDKAKRFQITLKPEIADDLDKLATEWGTTRSGMITILTKLVSDYELHLKSDKQGSDKITRKASKVG